MKDATRLPPHYDTVLSDFAGVADSLGIPFVLIGAAVRVLLFDDRYDLNDIRKTEDFDFGIQLQDWTQWNDLKRNLKTSDLFRDAREEHRLFHASGVPVDFVPFGGTVSDGDTVTFPESENTMSIQGFHEALVTAHQYEIVARTVPMATAPAFAVLKLIAYNDRRQNKDAKDLYSALTYYKHGEYAFIFDSLADALLAETVTLETAGGYLLGKDAGQTAKQQTAETVSAILDTILKDDRLHILVRDIQGATADSSQARRQAQDIYDRFTAFQTAFNTYSKQDTTP